MRVAYRFGNFGPKCGNFGEKTLQPFDSKGKSYCHTLPFCQIKVWQF